MFPRNLIFLCLTGLALTLSLTLATPNSKINRDLAQTLKSKPFVNIFVKFQESPQIALRRAEISHRVASTSQEAKINSIVRNLKALSTHSQKNALNILDARRRSHFPFSASTPQPAYQQMWVSNEMFIKGASSDIINELAQLPEVAEIREEQVVLLMAPFDQKLISAELHQDQENLEWNLEKVEAEQAWQLGGSNGEGIVVANIDTGVRYTHEALRQNFRSSYGWYDPYVNSELPIDENGHGTHTMGTLAGSKGIGIAPGAEWIACRGCDSFSCTESALKQCGQWILCPTLPNGTNPDCSKAPKVVNNSWGGGQGSSWYSDIIEAWKAAGIFPVFALGNAGPQCGTAQSPGDQADVIAVGSTTTDDDISRTSSVGPSVRGLLKPDISAPGHLVRSAWATNDTAYLIDSGTSMACPHVSGAVTLLLINNPKLTYSEVKSLLENNTDRNLVDTGKTCGGIPSTQFPNNQFGHGRLNIRKALEASINGIY